MVDDVVDIEDFINDVNDDDLEAGANVVDDVVEIEETINDVD